MLYNLQHLLHPGKLQNCHSQAANTPKGTQWLKGRCYGVSMHVEKISLTRWCTQCNGNETPLPPLPHSPRMNTSPVSLGQTLYQAVPLENYWRASKASETPSISTYREKHLGRMYVKTTMRMLTILREAEEWMHVHLREACLLFASAITNSSPYVR